MFITTPCLDISVENLNTRVYTTTNLHILFKALH